MKRATGKARGALIHGSGNVFEDLGFDKAEADVMLMRTDLLISIEKQLKAKGWTQREAAVHLQITQPRVSKLLQHKWEDFSLDMLLTLAHRAGLRATLKVNGQKIAA